MCAKLSWVDLSILVIIHMTLISQASEVSLQCSLCQSESVQFHRAAARTRPLHLTPISQLLSARTCAKLNRNTSSNLNPIGQINQLSTSHFLKLGRARTFLKTGFSLCLHNFSPAGFSPLRWRNRIFLITVITMIYCHIIRSTFEQQRGFLEQFSGDGRAAHQPVPLPPFSQLDSF